MREQMSPDTELVAKLMKRIENDATFQVENELEDLDQVVSIASTGTTKTKQKKYRRKSNNMFAAVAVTLAVLIASGLLISSLLGNVPTGQSGKSGAVVTSEVTGPTEYKDIYAALKDANRSNYGIPLFRGATSAIAGDQAISGVNESSGIPVPTMPQSENTAKTATDGSSPDYSGTNVQVEGIDEADIIKTDGTYIYVLRGEWFLIFTASGMQTEEISRMQIVDNSKNNQPEDNYSYTYDNPVEFYIHGSYASILVSYNAIIVDSRGYYTDDSTTKIICLDIRNPAAPKVATEFFQSGYYNSSRLQENVLYVISNYAIYEGIEEGDPSTYVPKIGMNGVKELVQCADICILPYIISTSYTVVTSIDLNTQKRIDQKSILGSSETIYMSYSNLYVASTVYTSEDKEPYKESVYTIEEHTDRISTQILRIALKGGSMDAVAQCTVDGVLLNQFSLDEYEGNLRLAVTVYSYSYKILRDKDYGIEQIVYGDASDQTNALYILGPSMNKLGSIEGLAKSERIYSVRFSGPVGYMVTFRQIDPLFALDLSDPKNPKVTSELKIPGFSTYMHPYGDGWLLGLGLDVNENRSSGMKLSMFDVSNAFDIREADMTLVGIYSSEALYNHKAVLVDLSRNIIGFGSEPYHDKRFYYLYTYSEDKGFDLRGKLELSLPELNTYQYSTIRGLYIDSYLYVYSGQFLDVFDLNNLKNVKALPIQVDSKGSYEQSVPMIVVD